VSVQAGVKSASHALHPGAAIPPKPAQLNTDSLVKRIGVDLASAMSAAAMICPVITVIDRYAFFLQLDEDFLLIKPDY
jgi:hypothetical protein